MQNTYLFTFYKRQIIICIIITKGDEVLSTVSERLIYLMETNEIKQTELASLIGISKQSLYKFLHCKCEPRAEIIARMAKALNTSADYIVGLTNNPEPIIRSHDFEVAALRDTELLTMFHHLSHDDKVRIEERMKTLLESN